MILFWLMYFKFYLDHCATMALDIRTNIIKTYHSFFIEIIVRTGNIFWLNH